MTHRLLVSVPEAARMLGISRRSVFRYIQLGLLRCTPMGRRRMIPVSEAIRLAERGVDVATLRRMKAHLGME